MKFEYKTVEINPESLFQVTNDEGRNGWEFAFLITVQKMVQHPVAPLFGSQQKPPEIITIFILLFKREIL